MSTNFVPQDSKATGPAWIILLGISLCHGLNDVMQSLLSALYPLLREEYSLDYWQIGLLTFAFQITASMLQPAVGLVTDRHPQPYSLPFAMLSTMTGLILLGTASSYPMLFAGAMLIGLGSAIFHPDASRVARLASGGRFATAQSFFQVGGNVGTALGPLLAAFVVVPMGRGGVTWFALIALVGMVLLWRIGSWYGVMLIQAAARKAPSRVLPLPGRRTAFSIAILALLVFVKAFYNAAILNYHTFYLMDHFHVGMQEAQVLLFVYLGASAIGVMTGGPLGDRFGRLWVIWFSILGVLPFTLALPYVDLFWTVVLSAIIGFILSSAFPAIVVYAQELVPGRVGMVAGLFFGLTFGLAGIGAAVFGAIGDVHGIDFVYRLASWLPILGLVAVLLPRHHEIRG